VVCPEFGRGSLENACVGTDHGAAGCDGGSDRKPGRSSPVRRGWRGFGLRAEPKDDGGETTSHANQPSNSTCAILAECPRYALREQQIALGARSYGSSFLSGDTVESRPPM
jgi:hypothetical protein